MLPEWQPVSLGAPSQPSLAADGSLLADHAYTREHPKRAKEFSEANNDRSGTDFVLVSSAWVKGEPARSLPNVRSADTALVYQTGGSRSRRCT